MSDARSQLESLHTSAVDARNGYEEAVEDADKRGLSGLFADMVSLHERNAEELAAELRRKGATADEDGSFMSVVHRTIVSIRGLFGALDETVLPGLIDGEERNVSKYDTALSELADDAETTQLLSAQRKRILDAIGVMRTMKL